MDIIIFLSFFLFSFILLAISKMLKYNIFSKIAQFGAAIVIIFLGITALNSPLEVVSGSTIVSNSSVINIISETKSFTYTTADNFLNQLIGYSSIFFGFALIIISTMFIISEREA